MACRVVVQSWTFCGLLGAFLDLAIAYFLLCCSAAAFFVAKFLGLFGLSLPCPCNGLFGYPLRGPCLQRLLIDCPTDVVSSVQLSVKTKFPFDAILSRSDQCQLNLKLVRDRKSDVGGLEFEGEASYSSFSDPRRSQQSLSGTGSDSIGKFDAKGKGAAAQRPRCGLRRRRRGSIDYGRLNSGSSYDHPRADVRTIHRSPSDPAKIGSELAQNANFHDVPEASAVPGREVLDFDPNNSSNESKPMYDDATWFENLKNKIGHSQSFVGLDEIAVRILEHALEEEQTARAALCSELEQERTAAATAADEAMSMISRLQEEKASIEIEARQYQRILEEKSAYDAEEMNLLKEIIVRHEREKHFLEKEVEFYQKVLQENEGLESQVGDVQVQNEGFLDSFSDPMMMLQQLSESIDRRGNVPNSGEYPGISFGDASSRAGSYEETKIVKEMECPGDPKMIADHLQKGDETSQEIQEKGILSMDRMPPLPRQKPQSSAIHDFHENVTILVGEQGQNDYLYRQKDLPRVKVTNCQREREAESGENHVHDVHIIDSRYGICNKSTSKISDPLVVCSDPPSVARRYELPEACNIQSGNDSDDSRLRVELEINRSSSDIVDRFPSVSTSPSRSYISELRRNSLPAVDYERMKIDSEIGWLRARLRAVQEEKEKLKNSLERRERGKTELQLLEDIAAQLREIRHHKEPKNAARQASLPPLSSKAALKKRRSRSVSAGACQSAST